MIFQTFHFSSLTPPQRIIAIEEGQKAFQQYFIEGKRPVETTIPVTKELDDFAIKPLAISNEALNEKVIDLFVLHAKIKLDELTGKDITEDKKSLRELAHFLTTDPNNIQTLGAFPLPMMQKDLFDIVKIRVVMPFLDPNFKDDDKKYNAEALREDPSYKAVEKSVTFKNLRTKFLTETPEKETAINHSFDSILAAITKPQIIRLDLIADFIARECKETTHHPSAANLKMPVNEMQRVGMGM